MASSDAARLESTQVIAATNRWMIPVAAVLIHICIGSVYAWSTFNRPIKGDLSDRSLVVQPTVYDFYHGAPFVGLERRFWWPLG